MKILPKPIADNLQAISHQVYQSADDSFEGKFSTSGECCRFQTVSGNEIQIFENQGGLLENFFSCLHGFFLSDLGKNDIMTCCAVKP